jgi:predicted DNA-binding protein
MTKLSERTTIYLNPFVKRYLQYLSLQEKRSLSDIINDEFADMLEDMEDIKIIESRKNEPTIAWEQVKKDFGL